MSHKKIKPLITKEQLNQILLKVKPLKDKDEWRQIVDKHLGRKNGNKLC